MTGLKEELLIIKKKSYIYNRMWYVAFTLGLLGSLHCVGMCGPLALAFCNKEDNTQSQNIKSALYYNLGRTTTYSFFGLMFGIFGSFLFLVDLQKGASIMLGVLLIVSFLFKVDINRSINYNSVFKRFYFQVQSFISSVMLKSQDYHSFHLGMVNGLLPCGLVYLALAGALSTGSVLGGIRFMALFGLGTLPMLFALTTGIGLFQNSMKLQVRRILPLVSLVFGIFLIYRGIIVDLPAELNFWEAIKNPVMCH